MNNYISLNIKYLCEQNNLHYNEFGEIVDAGRSVVSMWVSQKSSPKIDAIQKICSHFDISIDDFINSDLSKGKGLNDYVLSENLQMVAQGKSYEQAFYIIDKLEKSIKDKDLIIAMQRQRIDELEGKEPKTKRQAG